MSNIYSSSQIYGWYSKANFVKVLKEKKNHEMFAARASRDAELSHET